VRSIRACWVRAGAKGTRLGPARGVAHVHSRVHNHGWFIIDVIVCVCVNMHI
jgi:hypothetical protein